MVRHFEGERGLDTQTVYYFAGALFRHRIFPLQLKVCLTFYFPSRHFSRDFNSPKNLSTMWKQTKVINFPINVDKPLDGNSSFPCIISEVRSISKYKNCNKDFRLLFQVFLRFLHEFVIRKQFALMRISGNFPHFPSPSAITPQKSQTRRRFKWEEKQEN